MGNSYPGNLRGEEGRDGTRDRWRIGSRGRHQRAALPPAPRGPPGRGGDRGGARGGAEAAPAAGASSRPGPPRGACLSPPPHPEPPLLTPVPAPSSTSGLPGPFRAPALRARPAPVAPPGSRPIPPLTLCSVPRGAGRSRPRHVTRGRGARGAPGTAAPGRPRGRGCRRCAARPDGLALCRAQGKAGPARNKVLGLMLFQPL